MKAKPTGSFGIPEEIAKQVDRMEAKIGSKNEHEETKDAPNAEDSKDIVDDQQFDVNEKNKIEKMIIDAEKRLNIQIKKEDIVEYVKRGRLRKNDVQIIPGVLSVGFQTLSGEEIQLIQEKVQKFRSENMTSGTAYENEVAFWNLSYGLISYQGKDLTSQTDKQKVKDMLMKIGAHILDKMNQAYIDFNLIVKYRMNDADFLAK